MTPGDGPDLDALLRSLGGPVEPSSDIRAAGYESGARYCLPCGESTWLR